MTSSGRYNLDKVRQTCDMHNVNAGFAATDKDGKYFTFSLKYLGGKYLADRTFGATGIRRRNCVSSAEKSATAMITCHKKKRKDWLFLWSVVYSLRSVSWL